MSATHAVHFALITPNEDARTIGLVEIQGQIGVETQ